MPLKSSRKLNIKDKCFYLLLLLIPFVNIITLRLNSLFAYALISFPFLCIFILNLYQPKKIQRFEINMLRMTLPIVVVSILYLIVVCIEYDYAISEVFFFVMTPILLFSAIMLVDVKKIMDLKLVIYLKYLIVLISISIIVDYLLLNVFNLIHLQPMYRGEELWSYLDRPFGLFGQPSVNTSFLLATLLFLREVEKKVSFSLNVVVLIAVVLQGSGIGFFAYLMYLVAIFLKKNKVLLFLLSLILFLIVYWIIVSGVVEKISLEYINYNLNYFQALLNDFFYSHQFVDLFYGFTANSDITIDFGPIYMISKVGLFYFLLYTIYLGILFYISKSNFLRFMIFLLAFSNLHYPTMFYVTTHFLWILIYYFIFYKAQIPKNIISKT